MLEIAGVPTVADIVRRHAMARPEAIAIHFEGRKITYRDLDRRANQVANALIAAGIRPQARIAVLAKNGPAFFELWFGAAKANAVLVPVNFRLAPPEITFVLNDAQAELLFVGDAFMPYVGPPLLSEGSPEGYLEALAQVRSLAPRRLPPCSRARCT